jgi:hypothetical protein
MAAVRFVSPRYFLATSTAFLAWLRLRLERSSSSVDLEMLTNVSARLSSAEMNWCRRASRSLLNASYCESFSIHASRSGCFVRTLQLELEPDWNRFDSNDSCIVLCENLVSHPAACAGPAHEKRNNSGGHTGLFSCQIMDVGRGSVIWGFGRCDMFYFSSDSCCLSPALRTHKAARQILCC